jgi:hypothetical protein
MHIQYIDGRISSQGAAESSLIGFYFLLSAQQKKVAKKNAPFDRLRAGRLPGEAPQSEVGQHPPWRRPPPDFLDEPEALLGSSDDFYVKYMCKLPIQIPLSSTLLSALQWLP